MLSKGIKFFFFSFFSFLLYGEEIIDGDYPLIFEKHIPWELSGASERIEKFRKGNIKIEITLEDGTKLNPNQSVEIKQINHDFYFGGSLSTDWSVPSKDWFKDFKNYFSNLFNYATVNFYWESHEKIKGKWNYEEAPLSRDILNWALSKKMTLKGHPLLWHQVLPNWISDETRDVKEIDKDIRKHIKLLINEFPEIDHWDTYNEVPGIRWENENLGMRRWQKYLGNVVEDGEFVSGPGFVIKEVMNIARPLLPDGFFVLNHYDYTDKYYHQQIKYCLDNNIAFEAIGLQTHMHNVTQSFSEETLWEMLETYTNYGKPIHLSEISILSCGKYEDWKGLKVQNDKWDYAVKNGHKIPTLDSLEEEELYQAHLTKDFYTLAFSHPNVEVITWWTMSDLDPWRGMPCGLLDEEGNPKPVYHVLDQLINRDWKTNFSTSLDSSNKIEFRGFFGDYEIFLNANGKSYKGSFSLSKNKDNYYKLMLNEI